MSDPGYYGVYPPMEDSPPPVNLRPRSPLHQSSNYQYASDGAGGWDDQTRRHLDTEHVPAESYQQTIHRLRSIVATLQNTNAAQSIQIATLTSQNNTLVTQNSMLFTMLQNNPQIKALLVHRYLLPPQHHHSLVPLALLRSATGLLYLVLSPIGVPLQHSPLHLRQLLTPPPFPNEDGGDGDMLDTVTLPVHKHVSDDDALSLLALAASSHVPQPTSKSTSHSVDEIPAPSVPAKGRRPAKTGSQTKPVDTKQPKESKPKATRRWNPSKSKKSTAEILCAQDWCTKNESDKVAFALYWSKLTLEDKMPWLRKEEEMANAKKAADVSAFLSRLASLAPNAMTTTLQLLLPPTFVPSCNRIDRDLISTLCSNVDASMETAFSTINALDLFANITNGEQHQAVFGIWRTCSSWTSCCRQLWVGMRAYSRVVACSRSWFPAPLKHSATKYLYRQHANVDYGHRLTTWQTLTMPSKLAASPQLTSNVPRSVARALG
ncbi:hypothetical protein C8F01DRAFT_1253321 [Mycena amicta]|nr:hypothetical protein C8F01DRAFT_1253321 [Mycena amicta]